jgi:hypothetical protein
MIKKTLSPTKNSGHIFYKFQPPGGKKTFTPTPSVQLPSVAFNLAATWDLVRFKGFSLSWLRWFVNPPLWGYATNKMWEYTRMRWDIYIYCSIYIYPIAWYITHVQYNKESYLGFAQNWCMLKPWKIVSPTIFRPPHSKTIIHGNWVAAFGGVLRAGFALVTRHHDISKRRWVLTTNWSEVREHFTWGCLNLGYPVASKIWFISIFPLKWP